MSRKRSSHAALTEHSAPRRATRHSHTAAASDEQHADGSTPAVKREADEPADEQHAHAASAAAAAEPPPKRPRRAAAADLQSHAAVRIKQEEDQQRDADSPAEESKEDRAHADTTDHADEAAPAAPEPSAAAPSARPTRRLANVQHPFSAAAAAAAAASSTAARSTRARDARSSTVDLTDAESPRLISMPAPRSSLNSLRISRTRTAPQAHESSGHRSSRRSQRVTSYADGDSDENSPLAAEAASSSSRRASRSTAAAATAVTPAAAASSTKLSRSQRKRAQFEKEAREVGMPLQEYLKLHGVTLDSDADQEHAEDGGAAAAPAAAAEDEDDDDESVGPKRRTRGASRRKIIADESEGFSPSDSGRDDDRSSASELDDEEEEEEERGGRPRRQRKLPVLFAEEQAREALRRSGRNHRSSHEEERPLSPHEKVIVNYEKPIHKMEYFRLADGRVVSERDLRAMQRGGEMVRVLAEGEEPDADGRMDAEQAAGAAAQQRHTEFVRRSSRQRQQVQPHNEGQKGDSDDSRDGKRHSSSHARARAGSARRTGGGGSRHASRRRGGARRPMSWNDSTSPSSSSSSDSSDSSSSGGKRRRKRGRRSERHGIQPLHLQIQHAMRRMEHEESLLAGRSAGGLVAPAASSAAAGSKSRDGRLADIDPLEVDSSTNWSSIGGLDSHVHALKEMVVLPLLYPELFANFKLQPPRGVLFFGPPGTGKTLVARALANTCSSTGQRVSFFMRKGADCLSKWVGEAERQLRLLFEQAQKMQPSIIFFDEIDGLAPVRSSRQDQTHASIVSTLLALMDGLDNRGQVIVIGATNRPDSIDPALRRPGRFDRELQFALPNKAARRSILQIHTREWNPPLSESFVARIADAAAGYCGADIKALCTEATLHAVRRRYPQIYHSTEKLAIDVSSIKLQQGDFLSAMRSIVPAAQRSAHVWARAFPAHLAPLLQGSLDAILALIAHIFPLGAQTKSAQANDTHMHVDEDEAHAAEPAGNMLDVAPAAFPLHDAETAAASAAASSTVAAASSPPAPASLLASLPPRPQLPLPLRPRFLLHGASGSLGQSHLGPAILHAFEEYPIFSLDLPSLLGDGQSKNAEESVVRIIQEAKRNAPSIVLWPHVDLWWSTSSESLQHTTLMLLADLPPTAAIFLLATADCLHSQLPEPLLTLFPLSAAAAPSSTSSTLSFELTPPTLPQLTAFLQPIVDELRRDIPRMRSVQQMEQLPLLPRAADVASASATASASSGAATLSPEQQVAFESSLTPAQLALKLSHEDSLLRLQRMSLRGILAKLCRLFPEFVERLSPSLYPDYVDVVAEAIALDDLVRRVNEDSAFDSVSKLLLGIDLLVNNTKEYSSFHKNEHKSWVNKACHLQDTALSMIAQLHTKLVQECENISQRRAVRKAIKNAASSAAAAAAGPGRGNLRSQTKQQADVNMVDGTAAASSSSSSATGAPAVSPATSAAEASALPQEQHASAAAVASESSAPSPMEVDEKDVKQEGAAEATVAAAAVSAPAASPAAPVAASAVLTDAAPAAAASAPVPSPVPSPSLLPPPPPLQLDLARLSSLPAQLASMLLGSTVEQAEQTAFQMMKRVVHYQMLPDRNAAMNELVRIAQDNRP